MSDRNTEVLFPPRLIPQLAELDLPAWRSLLARVQTAAETSLERTAFTLMMTRLCGCESCQMDSFRGARGCFDCACQAVRRPSFGANQLEEHFEQAQLEVATFIQAAQPGLRDAKDRAVI